MRVILALFWAVVGVALVIAGLANRDVVMLRAMPDALADLAGISPVVSLPLFVVIFLGFGAGLLVGFVWEWLRESGERAAFRAQEREIAALRAELQRVKAPRSGSKDEILALLEAPPRRAGT